MATRSDQSSTNGSSSVTSWAQEGVAGAESSLTGGLRIGNSGASISSSSLGQKIHAAVKADKAAAEAAAIAKEKNDELDRCIARHAQNERVARTAAGTNADSGISIDSTVAQRLKQNNDNQAVDEFDEMLAKIQDPSDDIMFNKTIVDNSSSNNETAKIGEIFARPNIDDQSVSSVSVNMDVSNHLRRANTGTDLPSSSGSEGLDPIRARNVLLLHLPFPVTLHTLLKDNPCPAAIRWNAEGTKIVLHSDHKEFDHILRSYFGDNTTFTNLRRKANRWSFQTKCIDKKSSKHHIWSERFLKDNNPAYMYLVDICPAVATKTGHKRKESPHHAPARSSTTGADNKRSRSAGTTGTLPSLVTTSTNDASTPSFSNETTTETGPHGDDRLTSSNKKRKARPTLPFAMQEQSMAGLYLPRDSTELSVWLAEADI